MDTIITMQVREFVIAHNVAGNNSYGVVKAPDVASLKSSTLELSRWRLPALVLGDNTFSHLHFSHYIQRSTKHSWRMEAKAMSSTPTFS
jgi:hypothetical protein